MNETPHELAYSYRACTSADKSFMRSLHRRCYTDVVTAQFGGWDDDVQCAFFEKKWIPANYQIVVVENRDVGAICVKATSDHLFVSDIMVDPDYQNRGLGTRIVSDIVARGKSAGRTIRLQVLRHNRAIQLYRRLGFEQTGQNDSHVCMEKR